MAQKKKRVLFPKLPKVSKKKSVQSGDFAGGITKRVTKEEEKRIRKARRKFFK